MFAFVSLTPEESAIAREGLLPEPSFRPWPNSEREREMEEEAARELGDDPDAFNDPVPPAPGELWFDRVASAQYWKQHGVAAAILTVGAPASRRIIGLGTVEGGARTGRPGVRRVEIRIGRMLEQPVELGTPIAELSPVQARVVADRLEGPMRPLPPVTGAALVVALENAIPGLRREMSALVHDARIRRHAARRRKTTVAPARDAASTALHLFTSQWHRLEPVAAPRPSELARRLANLAPELENDVISDDASVFPGWERAAYPISGWWEFHYGDRRLLVKNINVSPKETATGADLVYVRTDPDAFVLVQYKMVPAGRDGRPYYRVDRRLDGQLSRMQALESIERGPLDLDGEDEYRLGSGFTFVKFVRTEDSMRARPGELASGYYMPTELVQRMLRKPDVGPSGGRLLYVGQKRSLTAENFAHLVRSRWIGSTGSATIALTKLFGLSDVSNVVLAVEEPRD